MADFVLDLAENPHPKMLGVALALRRRAHWWNPRTRRDWFVYRRVVEYVPLSSADSTNV